MKILEFFEENTGSFYATRLDFLLLSIGILVGWIIDSISRELEKIDPFVITVIGF